jgi:uncharacterized protein YbbC (DUF1343 family)
MRRSLALASVLLFGAVCTIHAQSAALGREVHPGVQVLADGLPAALEGKRVGLIANHTGLSASGTSTIDVLHTHPKIDLVALYAPEHGIRGVAPPGQHIAFGIDEKTGLPVHSLYGETHKPTREMLDGVEALVFDIQDIGTRQYTYISTMALAMQAAAEKGIPFVVLDRPNPIGGTHVEGNILDPRFTSFVGIYPDSGAARNDRRRVGSALQR